MTARIAVIGAGMAARSHALDIVTDPTMEFAGVAATSISSSRAFTDMFGGTAYPDIDAILDDARVDAVVVAVPPSAVLAITERFHSKPCLIEKPIVTTVRERHRLAELTKGLSHLIAPFNRRYQPHIREAATVIRNGAIGNILSATANWRGPYSSRFAADSGTYRASTGPRHGVLIDTGSHALDLISMLVGYVHPIQVSSVFTCNDRGTDVAAELEIDAGIPIHLTLGDAPDSPECGAWTLALTGEVGSLTLDSDGYWIHTAGTEPPRARHAEPMHRPATDLTRILDGVAPLGTPMNEVLTVSDVIIAAHDHSQRNRTGWTRPRGKALGRLNGAC
ncbi:Gfo/Idh/MocA family protein [Nocardia lijiangensis]|uniref:Gfo/Idh/MocA family protein n=1 Tax=Nocardia lijiangensis TaxID=299618 RepID=UPI003D71EAE3